MKRRYDLLYAFGALVSSPVLAFGLLRTGKWRTDWKGRFGNTPVLENDARPTLLLHGVSVGEINATRELVSRISGSNEASPRLVISATTNTGFDRARELYSESHTVVRFPFDFSWMVARFLDHLRPSVVALMELEVWPNLAQECQRRGIPLVVINGRLSDSSFGTYRWARRWVRPMFEGLAAVAAQTEEYAQRFRELGTPADRVTVTDNMKWDTVKIEDQVEGAAELGAAMGVDPSRPLVVAGSTGPGEEEFLIQEPAGGCAADAGSPEAGTVRGGRPDWPRRWWYDEARGRTGRKPSEGGFGASRPLPPGRHGRTHKGVRPGGCGHQWAEVSFRWEVRTPSNLSPWGNRPVIGPRFENFREVVSALVGGVAFG